MKLKDKQKVKKLAEKIVYICKNTKICGSIFCKWHDGLHEGRGCCVNCARAVGYWDNEKTRKQLKLSNLYNKKYGFFDIKNSICKLPAEKRSVTCLGCICEELGKKLTRKNRDFVYNSWQIIAKLRNE